MFNVYGTPVGNVLFANMRRGIGKECGEDLTSYSYVVRGLDVPEKAFKDKAEEEKAKKRELGNVEWAVYTALTLYSAHQQGYSTNMNRDDVSLGQAMAMLAKRQDDDNAKERIAKRLQVLSRCHEKKDIAFFLRQTLKLMKQSNYAIRLDFARLAQDLYWIMSGRDYMKDVYKQWAQDYYRYLYEPKAKGNSGK